MKKVGFIDYFLDEWHANNYPDMIKNASKGEMIVTHAYGKVDVPGKRDNKTWCSEMGIIHCKTIEQVVEETDYIIVLSPDNPEMHEELCQIPLKSGKPVYVDKTFAPTKQIAIGLFDLAKEHSTPLFSSSALRYSREVMELEKGDIDFITSVGPGEMENYLIHQVEPMVMLMDSPAIRLMYTGTSQTPCLVIDFDNDKRGVISILVEDCSFSSFIRYKSGEVAVIPEATGFFDRFIIDMVEFFRTGKSKVPDTQTIEIINIIDKAGFAREHSDTWIDLK
ncbi:MAG: hypothetical protein GX340_07305 [Clostridiales bacterium]|jgi:hypothetical protein|nr:hypothetical protein [Clostridiales bacterium]